MASISLNSRIRKAALVLESMDSQEVEAILARMDDNDQRALREAMALLTKDDLGDREEAVEDFLDPLRVNSPENLATDPQAVMEVDVHGEVESSPRREDPFASLAGVRGEAIAELVDLERPQTIAVIARRLAADQRVAFLRSFSAPLRAEIEQRMPMVERLPDDVIHEVAEAMAERLRRGVERRTSHGANATTTAPLARRDAIDIHDSSEESTPVAAGDGTYSPPWMAKPRMTWERLLTMEVETVRTVFAACPTEVVALALAGSTPEQFQLWLARWPKEEASRIRQAIAELGPTRLDDFSRAQEMVVDAARKQGAVRAQGRSWI